MILHSTIFLPKLPSHLQSPEYLRALVWFMKAAKIINIHRPEAAMNANKIILS